MMDNPKMTYVQKKALAVIVLGVLFLIIPDSRIEAANHILGLILMVIGYISYVNDKKEWKKMKSSEKIGSIVVSVAVALLGLIVFVNVEVISDFIPIISGIVMSVIGLRDLFKSKEPIYLWAALIYAMLGIVILLYPYETSASPVHIAGIFMIYYEIKIYLGEIYAC